MRAIKSECNFRKQYVRKGKRWKETERKNNNKSR